MQSEYLPQEPGLGSKMTCWRRLASWNETGVWRGMNCIWCCCTNLGSPRS
ncbi:hypothetical protein ACF1GY_36875 [Streptomyces sp. NPDC014684]